MLRKEESSFNPEMQQQLVAASALQSSQQLAASALDSATSIFTNVSRNAAPYVSTTLPKPGDPFRWALPDDTKPLTVGWLLGLPAAAICCCLISCKRCTAPV